MSSTRTGECSAVVRVRVFAAASALVTKKGPHNVTLPDIAQQAGVAASSLYHRWGDVGTLLLEVAAERLMQKFPLPDEGSTERIVLGVNSPNEPIFSAFFWPDGM
jgi:AcrR family transcriptional regulator